MASPTQPDRDSAVAAADALGAVPVAVTRRALFIGFLRIGLAGFGGVLPHARYRLVEAEGWISDQEFTELLSLGQLLPGPNIINVSIMVGARFHGAIGAVLAASGLLLVPLLIVLALGALYQQVGASPVVQRVFGAVSAAASGLIIAVGIQLARKQSRRVWIVAVGIAAFCAVGLFRLPLALVVLVLGPIGIVCAWKWRA